MDSRIIVGIIIAVCFIIFVLILVVIALIIFLLIKGKKGEKDAWKYLPESDGSGVKNVPHTEPVRKQEPEEKNTVPLWDTAATGPVQNYYIVLEEVDTGKRYSARINESIVIGRSDPADILLVTDGTISKKHCEIIRNDKRFILRDLGSSNGTEYNGVFINGDTLISNGSIIGIGKSRFRIMTEIR